MTQLHMLLLSEDDLTNINKIMANVAGISSPQKAVSWALQNVSIPGGAEPISIGFISVRDLDVGSPALSDDPLEHIVLPPQMHKTEIVKIPMSKLGDLKGSAILETGALKQIVANRAERAALLGDTELGFLK